METAGGIAEFLQQPRLFRQKILNRTLMVTLSTPDKLADLQMEAENYGRNGDFYRRAQCAVDLITGKQDC